MKYWQPYGVTDPNAAYQNGDLDLGINGSIPPGQAIEAPQREIVAVITAAGLTPDPNDNAQLLKVFGLLTPKIVSNPTLYVRTDGSDSNDGSANDSQHAFQTISAAIMKAVRAFSAAGTVLTIQLGNPGLYAAPQLLPSTSASILIQGDPANQSAYIVSGSGPGSGGGAVFSITGLNLTTNGVTLQNAGSLNHTLAGGNGGSVTLVSTTVTTTVTGSSAHLLAGSGGSILVGAGCVFSGSMNGLWNALGGSITCRPVAVTISGTPSYYLGVMNASVNGSIQIASGASFAGSALGSRYVASLNGVINTFGAGATFLPGNSAGSTSTGGQYA